MYDINGNKLSIAAPETDDGSYNTLLFKSIIFIGDSLTAGGSAGKAENSYPSRFGQITGVSATNAGVSGANPTSWLANEYDKYTYTDYDLAFIELGTNLGLSNTLDTDVNQYDSYEDYADTNTGNYCRMIEKIKNANPKLFMVLVISPNMPTSTSNVIFAIGEKYDMPVIDLRSIVEDLLNDKYRYAPGNIHQNALGYMAKARAVYKRFCKIVIDRADEIRKLLF